MFRFEGGSSLEAPVPFTLMQGTRRQNSELEEWLTSSTTTTGRFSTEELFTALRKGALLLKHGRQGKPKVHFFRVALVPSTTDTTAANLELRWKGSSGSIRSVSLRSVVDIRPGQTTDVFRRHPLKAHAKSFSLYYTDASSTSSTTQDSSSSGGNNQRTLDLTFMDESQQQLWIQGLALAVDYAQEALQNPQGATNRLLSALFAHTLGDTYVWGFAPRGTGNNAQILGATVSTSITQGASNNTNTATDTTTSVRWPQSTVPSIIPGNVSLDASGLSIGRRHSAVKSFGGCLFSFGEGRYGKLGQGHDGDCYIPCRVKSGTGGLVHVIDTACGDDCTAAITKDGTLYIWGRVSSETPATALPTPLRGPLRNLVVSSIACGAFHCAAVTECGSLFTWGEGFGGRLGHGDKVGRSQPTQVQAFKGLRVLEAACGVWHTAAIVQLSQEKPPSSSTIISSSAANTSHNVLGGAAPSSDAGVSSIGTITTTAAAISPSRFHHKRSSSSIGSIGSASEVLLLNAYTEGIGGALFTWGGVNEPVAFGDAEERRDSNKGCLGHGSVDLYTGQLVPARVGGALESRAVRYIAAGSHLTVAVTTGGAVYQMGVTGASSSKGYHHATPWEGAVMPEQVRGVLTGYFIDAVCCGMHHVVCVGRPIDKRAGKPAASSGAITPVFAWGRGAEGQLGTGKWEDSVLPIQVEALKGKKVLSICCGGSNSAACCEHDASKYDPLPGTKEQIDTIVRSLTSLLESSTTNSSSGIGGKKPPKGGGAKSDGGSTFSFRVGSKADSSKHQQQQSVNTATAAMNGAASGSQSMSRILSLGSSLADDDSAAGGSQKPTKALPTGGGIHRSVSILSSQHSLSSMTSAGTPTLLTNQYSNSRGNPTSMLEGEESQGNLSYQGRAQSVHSDDAPSSSSHPQQQQSGSGALDNAVSSSRRRSGEVAQRAGGGPNSNTAAVGGDNAEDLKAAILAGIDSFRKGCQRASIDHHSSRGTSRPVSKAASHTSGTPAAASLPLLAGGGTGSITGKSDSSRNIVTTAATQRRGGSNLHSPEQPVLNSIEQMLALKEADLEAQRSRLEAWELSLRMKEEALLAMQQQQQLSPIITRSAAATPPSRKTSDIVDSSAKTTPIDNRGSGGVNPLSSPANVIPRDDTLAGEEAEEAYHAAQAVQGGGAVSSVMTPSPIKSIVSTEHRSFDGGGGANGPPPPFDTPATAADEWTEEPEHGVVLTFAYDEHGTRMLRRIRFSREVFTKESAVQWYEVNKHTLAQTGYSPRSQSPTRPRQLNLDTANEQVSTRAAGESLLNTPEHASKKPPVAPNAVINTSSNNTAAAVGRGWATPSGGGGSATKDPFRQFVQLHGREGSRNLSFDAHELALIHAALQSHTAVVSAAIGSSPSYSTQTPLKTPISGGIDNNALPQSQQQTNEVNGDETPLDAYKTPAFDGRTVRFSRRKERNGGEGVDVRPMPSLDDEYSQEEEEEDANEDDEGSMHTPTGDMRPPSPFDVKSHAVTFSGDSPSSTVIGGGVGGEEDGDVASSGVSRAANRRLNMDGGDVSTPIVSKTNDVVNSSSSSPGKAPDTGDSVGSRGSSGSGLVGRILGGARWLG